MNPQQIQDKKYLIRNLRYICKQLESIARDAHWPGRFDFASGTIYSYNPNSCVSKALYDQLCLAGWFYVAEGSKSGELQKQLSECWKQQKQGKATYLSFMLGVNLFAETLFKGTTYENNSFKTLIDYDDFIALHSNVFAPFGRGMFATEIAFTRPSFPFDWNPETPITCIVRCFEYTCQQWELQLQGEIL